MILVIDRVHTIYVPRYILFSSARSSLF